MNQYSCKDGSIRVTTNQADIRDLYKHEFELSFSSFNLT